MVTIHILRMHKLKLKTVQILTWNFISMPEFNSYVFLSAIREKKLERKRVNFMSDYAREGTPRQDLPAPGPKLSYRWGEVVGPCLTSKDQA